MRKPIVTDIQSNFPACLMAGLRDEFGLTRFVETGTNRGDTALMAALAFGRVDTVELDRTRWEQAGDNFASFSSVTCWLSESGEWLRQKIVEITEPTLFYLDAHGLEAPTDEVNFPLKRELDIIGGLHGKHCIVIDDNPLSAVEPLVASWDYHGFGTEQFCVLAPRECEWERWKIDRPWYQF